MGCDFADSIELFSEMFGEDKEKDVNVEVMIGSNPTRDIFTVNLITFHFLRCNCLFDIFAN